MEASIGMAMTLQTCKLTSLSQLLSLSALSVWLSLSFSLSLYVINRQITLDSAMGFRSSSATLLLMWPTQIASCLSSICHQNLPSRCHPSACIFFWPWPCPFASVAGLICAVSLLNLWPAVVCLIAAASSLKLGVAVALLSPQGDNSSPWLPIFGFSDVFETPCLCSSLYLFVIYTHHTHLLCDYNMWSES